ncbi:MAG: glycerol-3-phosphate dehydrogenase, partial [Chloroflexota bacterium]|nr:glycerol-3-phosphate dehydrogenase [Chloroflexota bacterium]
PRGGDVGAAPAPGANGAAPGAGDEASSPGATALPGAAGYTMADVARAVEDEMALHVDDVLSRRLRLSFVDAAAAWEAAPAVARLMANRLGWASIEPELERFRQHLALEFGADPAGLHLAVTGS